MTIGEDQYDPRCFSDGLKGDYAHKSCQSWNFKTQTLSAVDESSNPFNASFNVWVK